MSISSKTSSNGIYSLNTINDAIINGQWPGSTQDEYIEPTVEFLLKFEESNGSRAYYNSINKRRWFVTSRSAGKGGLNYGDGSIVNIRSKFGSSCYGNNNIGNQYFLERDGIFMRGDPINITDNDFTIEAWIYLTTLTGNSGNIFQINSMFGSAGVNEIFPFIRLYFSSNGKLRLQSGLSNSNYQNTSSESSTSLSTNVWQHIVLTRKNGIYSVYLDGNNVLNFVPNTTAAHNYNSPSPNLFFSSDPSFLAKPFFGMCIINMFQLITVSNSLFADEVMFTNNIAKYTTNFTPPTTEISIQPQPTILFYNNFEETIKDVAGGGQTDLTQRNEYIVSKASVSSNDKKFGSSSLFFSNAHQQIMMHPQKISGDFNISIWIKPSVVSECPIFYINNLTCYLRVGGGTYNTKSGSFNPNNGSLAFTIGNTTIRSANNLVTTNTWHHIHVSRNNNTIRLFLNGNQVATGSSSSDLMTENSTMVIGYGPRYGANEQFSTIYAYMYPVFMEGGNFALIKYSGYMDEFIIDNKTGLTSVSVPTEQLNYVLNS